MFKTILFVLLIVALIWYCFYVCTADSESYNDYEIIEENDWQEYRVNDYEIKNNLPTKKQGTFIDPMDDLFVIRVVTIKQPPSFASTETKSSKEDTLALIERDYKGGISAKTLTERIVKIIPRLNDEDQIRAVMLYSILLPKKQYVVANDRQNSHDSSVNQMMRSQYQQLEVGDSPCLKTWLKDNGLSRAVTIMDAHNFSSSLNDYEENVYQSLWGRIHHPDNNKNREALKEAFRESIEDWFDGDYTHCLNGRISRTFGSLAILDNRYGVLKSVDLYKKECIDRAGIIYERFLNKYQNDPTYGRAARSYRVLDEGLIEHEDAFNKMLNDEITTQIASEYKHLSPQLLKEVLSLVKVSN
jgi:hypothetical protein